MSPVRAWLAICFLAGAGVMILELTAPRLMQPYFGASTFVWTNVIGVLLLALALGYNLGGRLAERDGAGRRVGKLLTLAGAAALLLLVVFRPLALWLLPDPGSLGGTGETRTSLALASFVTATVLFAPPVFLLATVSPQVIRVLVDKGLSVGRASGRVYMFGTLGSLAGTFLPTYVLVPMWGSRQSLVCAAAFLLAPGVFLLLPRRSGKAFVASVVLLPLALAAAWVLSARIGHPLRPPLEGEELVEEIESRYQYLRLCRAPALGTDVAGKSELSLRINEGVHEFHSVSVEDCVTTGGKYYDYFALLPALLDEERPLRALVLGSGAGTMARVLRDLWGDRIATIVNVELDPAIVALEPRFDPHGLGHGWETLVMDGRVYDRAAGGTFDLVFVDAYARQIDIPAHMATVEFFGALRHRLTERGILAVNLSGYDEGSAVIQAVARSLSDGGWSPVMSTPVRHWGNIMAWARRDGRPGGFAAARVPAALAGPLAHARRFTHRLAVDDRAPRLTDVHAPIEFLTERWLRGED